METKKRRHSAARVIDDASTLYLAMAADTGDLTSLNVWLDTPDTDINGQLMHQVSWFNPGVTALHCAARSGHLPAVERLVAKGANVNACTSENWTPLYYAANSGHTSIVQFLLNHGADKEIKDSYHGRSPLQVAQYRQFHDIVALLGGDPADKSYYRTPEQIAKGLDVEDKSARRRGKKVGRADVMRGVNHKHMDLFLGRYRISEEDILKIVQYRERNGPPFVIDAIDTLPSCNGKSVRVNIAFTHNRDMHNAITAVGSFIRSSCLDTNDFMCITRVANPQPPAPTLPPTSN
jgi:hypothetical protein